MYRLADLTLKDLEGVAMAEDREKKVLEALKKAAKPIRAGDLAKMMGEESKEISKIIDGLKKKGKVVSPKRCFYAPAEE